MKLFFMLFTGFLGVRTGFTAHETNDLGLWIFTIVLGMVFVLIPFMLKLRNFKN